MTLVARTDMTWIDITRDAALRFGFEVERDGDVLTVDLRAELPDGARTVTLVTRADGLATASWDGAASSGELTVVSGVVTSYTSVGPVADEALALATVVRTIDAFPSNFLVSPQNVALDWDCEIATIIVIAECGSFDVEACGEAVDDQFCACAPDDVDPPAGTCD